MSGSVFSRYEKKFLLSQVQYEKLRERLDPHMQEDAYGKYTICNIYYDTPDDLLIRRSLQKPAYKEKLRLRSYGTPGMDTKVFLEIKKKYRGIVNKRRIPLTLQEAYDLTEKGILPQHLENRVEEQICGEIIFFLQRYSLKRSLYLAYDRLAFSGIEDPSFRVTFDTSIRSRRNDVALEKGDAGTELLPGGMHLMEIKISGAVPHWFAGILSELDIRPVSFSKYGNIFKREHGAPMEWVTGKTLNERTLNEKERSVQRVPERTVYKGGKPRKWVPERAI